MNHGARVLKHRNARMFSWMLQVQESDLRDLFKVIQSKSAERMQERFCAIELFPGILKKKSAGAQSAIPRA